MAYVSVPKDLTKVKNKVAFNLTKRQLICIGIGAAMGIPCYFLFRNAKFPIMQNIINIHKLATTTLAPAGIEKA